MTSETAPKGAGQEETLRVICEYWPTASRLHFTIHGDKFSILEPRVDFVDDKRAVVWFEQMSGKTDPSMSMATIRQALQVEERLSIIDGSYGGAGVCGRTMEDEEQNFVPGLGDMLEHEKGKVDFIGNGISPVPLVVARRYQKKLVSEAPVVHDMFSYTAMEFDLWRLIALLDAHKLPVPERLEQYAFQASALCAAENEGTIRFSEYFFGLGNPPKMLQDASLVINLMGPPQLTLSEQLSLLRIGGRLVHMTWSHPYKSNRNFRVVDTIRIDNNPIDPVMAAEIIERIR